MEGWITPVFQYAPEKTQMSQMVVVSSMRGSHASVCGLGPRLAPPFLHHVSDHRTAFLGVVA